ncbi:MAG: COG1361 S-layer family protein [Candidatus Woesearchaeota archaeon]
MRTVLLRNILMKKSLLVMFVLLCVIVSAFAQFSPAPSSSSNLLPGRNIQVTMLNQEPDPVEPGKYVRVRFKIENYGTSSTDPIVVGVKPMFPFILVDGDYEQNIGTLSPMQIQGNSKIIDWRFLIDKDAPQGPNELTIYYKELSGQRAYVIYDNVFNVDVRTSDRVLKVIDIITSPEDVEPGKQSSLILRLQNLADAFIKDVKVSLDLTNVDIATVGSTSEKIIQRIDGREIVDVEFNIMPSSSASLQALKIPLKIEFKDNVNNVYVQDSTFGLKLNSPIKYMLALDNTDIIKKDQQGEVRLVISNTGLNNMRFTSLELKPSPDYTILSSPLIYIGNVDSDDFDSVTYRIFSKGSDDFDNLNLRLLVTYKDDYNNEYFDEIEVAVRLFNDDEITRYGLSNSGNGRFTLFLFILVLVGVGYWYYRRRKKKRELKTKN